MLRALVVLSLIVSLSACGSRLNPMNWFGGDEEERVRVVEGEEVTSSDPRPLVTEVIALSVEATTSGAIARATGVVPTQGYWQAELVPAGREDGTLIFEFRAAPPDTPQPTGSPATREIIAATALGRGDLEGVRSILVIGQANRRSVTRR
ncbi:hypothetical protein KUV65_04005 [Maritalea mobilis]|uniref:Lipoprotein n=1 Tax=[Roseibacterium] beibuensis TaxID=1193142 RepID=A0ABP9L223_9RHOB|nr:MULTISPECIES: hypothetical protein [Alphaproteobacteria]MBY6200515.1 hypothetical protein [Maritalea mobilis]MCS6621620.1 hypothetical protein [Roseibacterium beibuensis]